MNVQNLKLYGELWTILSCGLSSLLLYDVELTS